MYKMKNDYTVKNRSDGETTVALSDSMWEVYETIEHSKPLFQKKTVKVKKGKHKFRK